MTENFLLSSDGCKFIYKNSEIVIDPIIQSNADTAIFTSPYSAAEGLKNGFYNTVFTTETTKKLLCRLAPDNTSTNDIITCFENYPNRLRRNRKIVCEFEFCSSENNSDTVPLLITTGSHKILYTATVSNSFSQLPKHDIMIINARKKTPVSAILQTISEICIRITSFSQLYNVISHFNNTNINNIAGIDRSVIPAACEYLKQDYTVFSASVKPLASFDKLPPVIITKNPEYYNRPEISADVFRPNITLADIYKAASASDAKQIFAVCPDAVSTYKRGNVTICKNNTLTEY